MGVTEDDPGGYEPIGVFDSGIGGLTVAAALRRALPAERIYYIGDTARVPYGGKSRATVERYSLELGGLLLGRSAKLIVVACNTASALAIEKMRKVFNVPVVGVVAPGARAAASASLSGRIGIMATRATISSGAYEAEISRCRPDVSVHSQACPLLVPLIEEAWLHDPVTDQVLERYLRPLLEAGIDTLVLGCTHYPLLREAIARVAGTAVNLVDSAENCAREVRSVLEEKHLFTGAHEGGHLEVSLTDSSDRFLRTAERMLDLEIGDVNLLSVQS